MPGPDRTCLIAHYAFNTISLVVDSARKLGSLQAFGNPSQRPDGPWSGSQSAALTNTYNSNGGGQYFKVNNLNLGAMSRTTAGFSICTWFAFDATTMWSRVFDFGLGMSNNNIYVARVQTSETLQIYYSCRQGHYQEINLPKPIINGKWRHVCVVNLGRNWSIYDDGALAASRTATCDLTNTLLTSNYIGRSNWNWDPLLVGRVDEFRIYDRALSAWQVTNLYGYKGAESQLPAPLSLPPNAPSGFCP
jgi:hypothetical protein